MITSGFDDLIHDFRQIRGAGRSRFDLRRSTRGKTEAEREAEFQRPGCGEALGETWLNIMGLSNNGLQPFCLSSFSPLEWPILRHNHR